jgi:hypothetical protein
MEEWLKTTVLGGSWPQVQERLLNVANPRGFRRRLFIGGGTTMARFRWMSVVGLGFVLTLSAWGQSTTDSSAQQDHKSKRGAAREIGSGAGTVGVGAARGAGDVAKGTGKGAVDLVTLHPVEAGGSIGKGAAHAGKDVTVGTVKGTGKVARGIGRGLKHLF